MIGSVGPGTKQPSITESSIACDFDTLYDSYKPQMRGMIEGGVDAILIETCFDILANAVQVLFGIRTTRN